jgi:hypothetical protein
MERLVGGRMKLGVGRSTTPTSASKALSQQVMKFELIGARLALKYPNRRVRLD